MRSSQLLKGAAITAAICLIIVAAFVLNGFTGDDITAKNDGLQIQSTLEMEETNINSQMGGQIQEMNAKIGDAVKKGQIIAVLNSDTLNAQREQAEASLTTIRGQILSAQTSRDLAKTNLDRISQLYSTGAVSKSTYDSAKAQYDTASAALVTLQGQHESANAGITEVDTYLDKNTITAPTDGIITELNVENGELVSSGTPIAVITNTSEPWVLCYVMETDLSNVRLNQPVQVKFEAYPENIYHGTVTKINKNADFAVKRATNSNGEFDVLSYGIRVELTDIDVPLYAGMTTIVNFDESDNNDIGEN